MSASCCDVQRGSSRAGRVVSRGQCGVALPPTSRTGRVISRGQTRITFLPKTLLEYTLFAFKTIFYRNIARPIFWAIPVAEILLRKSFIVQS